MSTRAAWAVIVLFVAASLTYLGLTVWRLTEPRVDRIELNGG